MWVVQLWALPEVRALTAAELEAHVHAQEEPEEDAEEAQADAAAADKAEEGRASSAPPVAEVGPVQLYHDQRL